MTARWDVVTLAICVAAVVCNVVAFVGSLVMLLEEPVLRGLLGALQICVAVWMWVLAGRAWRRLTDRRRAAWMNVRVVRAGVELPARLYHFGVRDGLDTW